MILFWQILTKYSFNELIQYTGRLSKNGILMLSGFLESDFFLINKKALDLGLKFKLKHEDNNWQCLVYVK